MMSDMMAPIGNVVEHLIVDKLSGRLQVQHVHIWPKTAGDVQDQMLAAPLFGHLKVASAILAPHDRMQVDAANAVLAAKRAVAVESEVGRLFACRRDMHDECFCRRISRMTPCCLPAGTIEGRAGNVLSIFRGSHDLEWVSGRLPLGRSLQVPPCSSCC